MADITRKQYLSDLTDQQWEIVREVIPQPRKSRKGGRPRSVDMREVVRRPKDAKGFVLLPKRFIVERKFSWLGRWRQLNCD